MSKNRHASTFYVCKIIFLHYNTYFYIAAIINHLQLTDTYMKKTIYSFIAGLLLAVPVYAQTNKIEMITDSGRIVMMLYDNTPLNTNNMVKNAREHVYDSTLFHRVIPNFMIQGGDPTSKHAAPGQALGSGGLQFTVPAEINDSDIHKRGALAVARDGNPAKAGSACQFYIVVGKKATDQELDNISARAGRKYTPQQKELYKTIGGTPFLDGNYTVFGEVVEGMDVVDKIIMAARDGRDRPNNDIRIQSLHVLGDKEVKKKRKGFFSFLRRKDR